MRSPRFTTAIGSYGSIIATPPEQPQTSDVASLRLPDPAIDPGEDYYTAEGNSRWGNNLKAPSPAARDISRGNLAGTSNGSPANGKPPTRSSDSFHSSKWNTVHGTPSLRTRPTFLKRVFSLTDHESLGTGLHGEPLSEFELRQDEFFAFLDSELSKIESFYKTKEKEATERLKILREQLHIMGDRRIQEVLAARNASESNGKGTDNSNGFSGGINGSKLRNPIKGRITFGKNSEALPQLATPGALQPRDPDLVINRRDFMRRPESPPISEVPYRSAKRKLKQALQEFYRGLELLKSYAYLNRTAFRKINKKYDKVAHARPTMRYMSEKVNKAWFVQSEVTDSLMVTVEDLYARYFERGNRKIAVSKLRHTMNKPGDYSPNTFRVGLLLMGGILFGIQALVYAVKHLDHSDPTIRAHTSYLLQVSVATFPLDGGYEI